MLQAGDMLVSWASVISKRTMVAPTWWEVSKQQVALTHFGIALQWNTVCAMERQVDYMCTLERQVVEDYNVVPAKSK
jgi:predicted NAD/FAD-binding protein